MRTLLSVSSFFLESDRKIDGIAVFMLNKTFKFNHSLNKMV